MLPDVADLVEQRRLGHLARRVGWLNSRICCGLADEVLSVVGKGTSGARSLVLRPWSANRKAPSLSKNKTAYLHETIQPLMSFVLLIPTKVTEEVSLRPTLS